MESKLLFVWGTEPGAGCTTIAEAMASRWIQSNQEVLLVKVNPALASAVTRAKDPAVWVPQFKSLAPKMLRNYLHSASDQIARLDLSQFPSPPVTKELMPLLRSTFEWVIWQSPVDWTPEALAVLDHANLLLWVTTPRNSSRKTLEGHFAKLASLHYPNSLSQIIHNKASLADVTLTAKSEIEASMRPLASVPYETPRGIQFARGVQQCVEILQSRPDLYRQPAQSAEPAAEHSQELIDDIKSRIKPKLMEAFDKPGETQAHGKPGQHAAEIAQQTLATTLAADTSIAGTRQEREQIYTQVMNEVLGLGPLEPLLKDPSISEVMVNGKGSIFVERKGKLFPTGAQFSSDAQLRTVIDRIVAPIGRRVDESMPLCDARLADGSRVNIVLPPLALDGATLTIRKFMAKALTLYELIDFRSISRDMADFLQGCVLLRKNIVVAGGTGSGKTTLLNALSGLIPDDERIVTIEDAAELRLQKPHVVRLESRPPNAEGEGAIPIRRLVINALRMRPDRIVVGECRGGEALDMLQAMNTGHDGSLTTVHANSPRDALRRLETLVLMAGMDLPVRVVREQIQSAVDILIQQSRMGDGSRKVTSITEVTGMEGDTLTIQEIFRLRIVGAGHSEGGFESTGIRASFAQEIAALAKGVTA